jgi:hypothetical protein
MRTKPSYLLLTLLTALAVLLTPSCDPNDLPTVDLPLTASIVLDFSDASWSYRYIYEGESYPATYKAWVGYNCLDRRQAAAQRIPIFFALYNDIDQTNQIDETIWLAHCTEGIYHQTINITTNGTNTNPATIIDEITGGQEETLELQIPTPNLADIQNGTSQITISFLYQND